jgi:hypothetical protein
MGLGSRQSRRKGITMPGKIASNLSVRSTLRARAQLTSSTEHAVPDTRMPNGGMRNHHDDKLDEIRGAGWESPLFRQGHDGDLS